MNKNDTLMVIENFSDVGIEMSETIIDTLLQEGILKDIPLVGTLVSFFKAGKQLKDTLYLAKLQAFVCGYAQLPPKMQNSITSDLEDTERKKELGFKLLLIIERVDSVKKAELIGKAFKLLINEEISQLVFLRLSHMIDKTYYDDLFELVKFDGVDTIMTTENIIEPSILEGLFTSGWLANSGLGWGDAEKEGGPCYSINDYGKIIIRLLTERA